MVPPREALFCEFKPGDTIGDFVVRGATAETRLGSQYAAVRKRDDVAAAVWVVPSHLLGSADAWDKFVATTTGIWQQDRQHIAPVVGSGALPDGRRWIAYALAEGRTLGQLLEEHPLEPAELLSTLRGVCRALEAAHRQRVFHGDLNPANVCISSGQDGRMRAKLLGLGTAALLSEEPPTAAPLGAATRESLPFGNSRDLRDLGKLCFEALCGQAYEDDGSDEPPRVSDVRPELGPHFDEPVHSLFVVAEQPVSAADAHSRMVKAAREAGYEVGSAIPAAPRNSLEPVPVPRTSNRGAAAGGPSLNTPAAKESSSVGRLLLAIALVVLIVVLWKTRS